LDLGLGQDAFNTAAMLYPIAEETMMITGCSALSIGKYAATLVTNDMCWKKDPRTTRTPRTLIVARKKISKVVFQ
jgi:hypothetical protein